MQDEDHEAGIEAALDDFLPRYVHRWEKIPNQADHRRYWRTEFERLVPFLSRVSPSRVGSVAVEDVERLTAELRALVDWFNEAPFLRAERLLHDLLRDDGMSESRWSPEDYEAGKALLAFIRANRSWFCGGRMMEPYESQAAEKLSAYLARVSPSRVGSVAVEALRRLVELKDDPDHDNIDPVVKGDAWRAAREALAEFFRSSTDRPEQPEPDALGGQPPAEPETTGGTDA